ncbi:cardiolipin synthase ClsB [Caldimonas sp. KR1-144]|uniref:cardiolipin synthase ClsB n=1 Tax=Caldimonas sp. KR1-144 TaxID=3400911 RepID=UPI003C09D31A
MKAPVRHGNRVTLLENGEEFFPAVFGAIDAARRDVVIETFILFEDKVGLALRDTLVRAARRGVEVDLLVDGFGSADLSAAFVDSLVSAGVRYRVFAPGSRWLGFRVNLLRRMHRKLAVIDGERAFVGGINYSADHLGDYGPEAKQDYSVEVRGPLVADIHRFVRAVAEADHGGRHRLPPAPAPAPAGSAQALFVTRDNHRHRTDIERHYRLAIRAARREVLIANAYFFPGWRLLQEMRRAARRGVRVRLVLQGEPDMAIVKAAAALLYEHLLHAGVEVYEYCERPMHGKVAQVDDIWATVGSSNLDPLSLSLNLEANVVVRDAEFALALRTRLERLLQRHCRPVERHGRAPGLWALARSVIVFHFLRRFPAWAAALPPHEPFVAVPERASHS